MPNFILIGMPASGKSTLGKMAAAALQYNFVDTDDTIMDTYHADLMHLIDQFGIDGFIELESKILQQVQAVRFTAMQPCNTWNKLELSSI